MRNIRSDYPRDMHSTFFFFISRIIFRFYFIFVPRYILVTLRKLRLLDKRIFILLFYLRECTIYMYLKIWNWNNIYLIRV